MDMADVNLTNTELKEINKLRLNQKFDTQFKVKDFKEKLLLNRYGKLQKLCKV